MLLYATRRSLIVERACLSVGCVPKRNRECRHTTDLVDTA
jgi:hypothetical protein